MKLFRRNTEPAIRESAGKELLDDGKRIMSSFILTCISALITIPLFIIVYRYVPDIIIPAGKGIRIDHLLAILIIFAAVRIITYYVRFFIFGAIAVLLVVLVTGQITGGFGFTDVYSKYKDMVTYVGSNPIRISFLGNIKTTIPNADRITAAIDYNNPTVRDYAVAASQKHFNTAKYDYKYRNAVRYFSIFKVMSKWRYVADPQWEDYYAKASESVPLMAGDCDDYSILMAACIKAVGGEVRLVRTPNHLYPEVKICNSTELQDIVDLIKNNLFYKESLGARIYYHVDDWNNIWLNFDYTNVFPGGEYMNGQITGILGL